MNKYILNITIFLFANASAFAQPDLCTQSGDFEGTPQAHFVPAPWSNCGGSPDTQPGFWGFTQPASSGSTYLSFLQAGASAGGYYEGASQILDNCMATGQTYTISLDLAHSNVYNTASPGDCYSSFAIYGGSGICNEGELLGQVGPIMHTNWITYTFTFTPTSNWCYISFRPIWISSCNGYINIMVDNMTCASLVNGVVVPTNVTCNGACDGTAKATPTSGVAPFTYLWTTGAATDSISGLCPGLYSVTITDNTGATTTGDVTIIEPPVLALTVTATNVSCLNGMDGSAAANVTGGTTPYTYLWNNGAPTPIATNLVANNYSVTVTDANGCQINGSVAVLDGGIVAANISNQVNVACFGGNNGTASVTVTDGVPKYTYLWSNGQNSTTATFLTVGPYTVTVTDMMGCSTTVSVVITEPPALTASMTSFTNVKCNGACDGTATVTPVGGTGTYTYLWPNGQTLPTGTGLCVGSTVVDVFDSAGCQTTATVVITEPPVLALSTNSVNPSCVDTCDGSASVVVVGGTTPYGYSWNTSPAQSTTTASNLCDGSHTITVTDSNLCVALATVVLIDPPLFVAAISAVVDINCNGNCNGYAQVTTSGGGAPYTYQWITGDTSNQVVSLCQGNFDVTVTNTNGCRSVASGIINEPPALTVSMASTNVTCFNACDGSATATAAGGIGAYTYLWDDANLQTNQTAANLCSQPGGVTVGVVVRDSNNCSITGSVLITQPTQIGLTQNVVSPTTCGSNNGSACVNAFGGTSPYVIAWSDSAGTVDSCVSGVYAGTYFAYVTDGLGCKDTLPVVINDVAGPAIDTIAAPPVLCNGDNNGTATVTISGGIPNFTYLWFDGGGNLIAQGTTFIYNLDADNYSVTIIDNNNCNITDTFAIAEPPFLATAIDSSTNTSCFGGCDGTASVLVAGGVPPYGYLWTNGQTGNVDSLMCAGLHNVVVADNNGCTSLSAINILEPPFLLTTIDVINVSCNGDADGSICLTPSGGTPGYTYLWIASGGTQSCLTGQTTGTYAVDITDLNGCTRTENIQITEPTLLSATALNSPSKCGNANGEATVNPSGGTQPWSYSWDDGQLQSTQTATDLLAGTYNVTVTDANNCTYVVTNIVLFDIPAPVITGIATDSVKCYGDATGSATVTVTGGTPPLTYLWDDPAAQATTTATGLAQGDVTVQVEDLNGCLATLTATVEEPTQVSAIISSDATICFGENATISGYGKDGTPPYIYYWDNGPTTTAQQVAPPTTTTYLITVEDANACLGNNTVTITVLDSISIVLDSKIICEGDNTTLSAFASGGTGTPYTWVWNPLFSSETIAVSPSVTTTYNVTVTDANNCSTPATAMTTVTVNPRPDPSFVAGCYPDAFITQFNNGSTIDAPGTINGYTWDFGDPATGPHNTSSLQNPTHDFSTAGMFTVTLTVISDQNCQSSIQQLVMAPPVADFTVTPLETSELNPTITISDNSTFTDPSTFWQWDFDDDIIAGPGAGNITDVDYTTGTYTELEHEYQDTGRFFVLLTIEEPNGCKDTMGIWVEVESNYILFTPNAFAPASSIDKNKFFKPFIIGIDEEEFEFIVFDRWGDRIYVYEGAYAQWLGWDGSANNGRKVAQMDVYIYLIRTLDLNSVNHEYIGHFTLLR
ncbi:MAG TPA: PKD domain-containing protein [Flavobacteriales bacterium]|nr:PKD domain-containing protein [Flavobacteriales bacterium]